VNRHSFSTSKNKDKCRQWDCCGLGREAFFFSAATVHCNIVISVQNQCIATGYSLPLKGAERPVQTDIYRFLCGTRNSASRAKTR
jgi:hypothetical protein